jgi:hypothetical protein
MSESLIDQYCRIVDGGAEFDDPRLQQLRERMTDEDRACRRTAQGRGCRLP